MGISDILKVFENYGMIAGIFAIIIFVVVAVIKSKWFSDFFSKISDKFVERFMKNKIKDFNQAKVITESDITNHDIFNYIDFWTYSKVPTFQFSTDYRTAVFRKYLMIFLKCYKSNLSKFVNNREYQQMDEAQIWRSILNTINTIVYDYEREMLDSGIPKIIIDKMKVKNNDNITLTIDLIEGVCSSQFYESENNFLKVYSILNILLSVLENTIMHSEPVCNSINGQLKGLSFEGKTEP